MRRLVNFYVYTGTIRGDYAIEVRENICHASDTVESAEREIAIWFGYGVNSEL